MPRICLARSLSGRTERGLQSAGRLGSEVALKFPSADLQCRRSCGINPALLAGSWFVRQTHTTPAAHAFAFADFSCRPRIGQN
jgi:hypothetical protein